MKNKDSKLASLLVDAMEGEEEDSAEEESSELVTMDDYEVAAQEVMDAVRSRDAGDFANAMKAFIKLCSYDKEK